MEGLATNAVWEAGIPAVVTANVAEEPMLWATNREATKEEDQAHCLMGIFNIHQAGIDGDGKHD